MDPSHHHSVGLEGVLRGSGRRDFLERDGGGFKSRSGYAHMGNEKVEGGVQRKPYSSATDSGT